MARRRNPKATPLSLPGGARATPQRRLLLELIAGWPGRFTPLDVYDEARKRQPGVGLATVYRTVELLRQNGSVRALRGEGVPAYVRCRPEHHHHLVCLTCGAVEETELCSVPSAAELRRRHGFAVQEHELDLYGTCARCSAA